MNATELKKALNTLKSMLGRDNAEAVEVYVGDRKVDKIVFDAVNAKLLLELEPLEPEVKIEPKTLNFSGINGTSESDLTKAVKPKPPIGEIKKK